MTVQPAPLSLEKVWQQAWPERSERTALHDALRDLGFDATEAHAWMATPMAFEMAGAGDLLEIATAWVTSGLPTEAAIAFAETMVFEPQTALAWHSRGFTARQATLVHSVVPFNLPRRPSSSAVLREESAWLHCGLSPDLVVLGAAAGVTAEGMSGRITSGMSSKERGLMALMADLRGVDVRELTVDYNLLARGW